MKGVRKLATVANQKTITVNKEACDKNHLYATISLEAMQHAMLDLKNETLKLWFYIAKNQKGYSFGLSKVDAIKWGVGSKSSYDRAVKELIEKKYLVETTSNHYDFYEIPKEEAMVVTIV